MTLENSLSVCYSSLVINFLSSGSYSLTPLPGYLANGKIGVVTDDDDEFDDDDDRSEWHNNHYTREAYSYLATDGAVIGGGGGDGDGHDDDDDDDHDDDDDDDNEDDDRSEWHNNPYTRGAYSYLATGVPLELHDMLRQPLPSTQV